MDNPLLLLVQVATVTWAVFATLRWLAWRKACKEAVALAYEALEGWQRNDGVVTHVVVELGEIAKLFKKESTDG